MIKQALVGTVACLALLTATACGDDDQEVTAGAAGGGQPDATTTTEFTVAKSELAVVLDEFTVTLSDPGAAAGPLTIQVTNEGGLTHRLLVLATELDYFALPKNDRGGLDLTSAEITVVADSGDIAPGGSATITTDLAPGSYVLADPGDPFVTVGMRAPLAVEVAG
ncbi:MAG: hypothetical protein ACRD0A_15070 [Acidimicrobiales bacterium]